MIESGQPAPDFKLDDQDGARSTSPTTAATGSSSTSTQRPTRRGARPRPAASATAAPTTRRPTRGPRHLARPGKALEKFAEKHWLTSRSSPTRTTRSPRLWRLGREVDVRAGHTGATSARPSSSPPMAVSGSCARSPRRPDARRARRHGGAAKGVAPGASAAVTGGAGRSRQCDPGPSGPANRK